MALTLVNQYPSSTMANGYAFAGPQSLALGNATGNLLIAFAAWDVTTASGATAPVPASSIADSSGNWWRLIGDSGNGDASCRVVVWVCANAMNVPATTGWWSFALQGYATSAVWGVTEFSGLPSGYAPLVDFSVPTTGTGASMTLSAQASQSDYCFAIGAAGSTITQINPSGAWSTAMTGVAGSGNPDPVQAGCVYQTAGAGTVSATWSWVSTVPFAGVLIGLSAASAPPVIANPDYPVVKVEAAFGSAAGDPTHGTLDMAWTDITQRAMTKDGTAGITVSRGRQYELGQPEAGTLAIALNNIDGAFNPLNTGSPYYSLALNQNMSFESGITPWSANPLTGALSAQQSSAFAFSGTYSMLVTPTNTGFSAVASEPVIPVNQNNPQTASAWFYSPGGWPAGGKIQVTWLTAGHVTISTVSSSVVALPAGAWTQVSATFNPPVGTAYAQLTLSLAGSPTSANVYYVDEAALTLGVVSVATHLVRLSTPVRVSAFWQGRRYPVGMGYVERWPQDWPDLTQWGFSNLIATDQVGVASATNLPSAVQGEILADNPYICFPFDEQYSTSTNTLNGVVLTAASANGLLAVNSSRTVQKTAVYKDGEVPVSTGQSLTFLGDAGTGMGCTAYSAISITGNRGPGALYGYDLGMPAVSTLGEDATIEVWSTVPSVANGPSQYNFTLLQAVSQPAISKPKALLNISPGTTAVLGWQLPATTGAPVWFAGMAENVALTTAGTMSFGALYRLSLTFSNGNLLFYVNTTSVNVGAFTNRYPLTGLEFGNFHFPFDYTPPVSPSWNFSMAYASVYPYAVPAWRQTAHYTAGSTGFSGDTIMQRFGRYVAWGYAAVLPAGPGAVPDAFKLGPAYSTAQSPLASALNADALSSNAVWYATGNGNLVVASRPSIYNQPVSVTFGDNPVGPLNANPFFRQQVAGWASSAGATVTAVTSPVLGESAYALALTPDGVTASPRAYALSASSGGVSNQIAAVPGTMYSFSLYCACPATWASGVIAAVDWYTAGNAFISTSASGVTPVNGQWQSVVAVGTAPSTAAYGIWYLQGSGTPPSSTVFYIAHAVVSMTDDSVPFLPLTGFDYDNTYVSNTTQATLRQGPSTLIAPIEKNFTSIIKYGSRGPLSQDVNGTSFQDAFDRADWSLSKYAEPSMRARTLQVNCAANPLVFTTVLSSDLQSIGQVMRAPIGGAPWNTYNLTVITEKVEHSIGPSMWTTSYQLSPYVPENAVLQTDTAGSSVLGSNSLAW